jgi:hypothetical protein
MTDNQIDSVKKINKEELSKSRKIVLETIGESAIPNSAPLPKDDKKR